MEEIKIGEVFQVGRVKLKCVEDFDDERCDNCTFYELGGVICAFLSNYGIECDKKDRKDHTQVVFIKIEEE